MTAAPFTIASIRRVARSGDTMRAWRMFETSGLLDSADPDVLGLRGRLLKDRGLKASGEERARLLDDAAATYLASGRGRRATYPLINAATIAFLNGKPCEARELARRTIALLDGGDHEPETAYWLAATRVEAAFLLGDFDAGRAALEHALAVAPDAWEDQAATLRQLEAVLAAAGRPGDLLDPLRPPASLHFGGLIDPPPSDPATIARIERVLDEARPGFVFGALAAGTDIIVAELALARGARLHAVLPTTIDAFRAQSVTPYGADWAARFDRLIEQAAEVDTLTEHDRFSAARVALSEDIAMGLAIRRSRALASRAYALRVRRASDPPAPSDLAWQARGLPLREVVVDGAEGPAEDADNDVLRAVLAFNRETLDLSSLPDGAAAGSVRGSAFVVVPDLAAAADFAADRIASQPDLQVGLDYRVFDGREFEGGADALPDIATLAAHLARAAPAGAILAAWPGAVALDLRTPDLPFEAAGEIVTPAGDVAVSIHQ